MSKIENSPTIVEHKPYIPQKNFLRPFSGRVFSKVLAKTEQPNLSFFNRVAISLHLVWCALSIPLDMTWNIVLIPITFICMPIKYTFKLQTMPGIKDWFLEIKMVFVCVAEIGIFPLSGFLPRGYAVMHHALVGYRTFNVRIEPQPKTKDLELKNLDTELENKQVQVADIRSEPEPQAQSKFALMLANAKLKKAAAKQTPDLSKESTLKEDPSSKKKTAPEVAIVDLMRSHLMRNPNRRKALEHEDQDLIRERAEFKDSPISTSFQPLTKTRPSCPVVQKPLEASASSALGPGKAPRKLVVPPAIKALENSLAPASVKVAPIKGVSFSVKTAQAKNTPSLTQVSAIQGQMRAPGKLAIPQAIKALEKKLAPLPAKSVPALPKARPPLAKAASKVVPTQAKAASAKLPLAPTTVVPKVAPSSAKSVPAKVILNPAKGTVGEKTEKPEVENREITEVFMGKLAEKGMLDRFEAPESNDIDPNDTEWNQ